MHIDSGRMLYNYIEPNRKQYCIPVFQRDYAWTDEQCKKLFEDIVLAYKKDRPHFCGSFVYAPLKYQNNIDYYIIIDGQQRYTTLYILIKALADSTDDPLEKDALEELIYNKDRFNRYGLDEKSKLKLKPVKTDNDQLLLLMSGRIDEMDKTKNGIIYHNYMLFRELIEAFLKEDPDNSVMMIHDGIDQLICADIRLGQDDDAQEIFERINSTGIKLGLPDLIRNYVLMTDKDQERLYEEYWLPMQELLSRDGMDSFFMDYLNMKIEGFTKESTAYADFKKHFLEGKYTNESILQELLHYARQYYMFNRGSRDLSIEVNEALTGLKKLGQTTVYLFLFSLFDDYEAGVISEKELDRVMTLLYRYSIRRLVCEVPSNTLRSLYKYLYSRAFSIPENKNHYYDAIVSYLYQVTSKDVIPSEAEFALALKERNLYRKNALCKLLLAEIENQGKERIVTDDLTIEHIMPQNRNLSRAWQQMLGPDWQAIHDRYLHTLGNLTLTGYNSELGDLPFSDKQKKLEESITHITVLDIDVKDKQEWNAATIESRADRLVSIILERLPIEQPVVKIEFSDPRYSLYTAANPRDAKFKQPNFYELQGERVRETSFNNMVRSVAKKLYELDSDVIERMALTQERLPGWQSPVFSYEPSVLYNPVKLFKDRDIYISSGFSATDCMSFIRGLLKKHGLDPEEEFVYSAKATGENDTVMDRMEIERRWCEKKNGSEIGFDPVNSTGRYVRFTTPLLDSIIPLSSEKPSPWNTQNYYFYEITNQKTETCIKLVLYCYFLTPEMKDVYHRMAKIIDLEELDRKYRVYFQTASYPNTENDSEETVNKQLDSMFEEVQRFEGKLKEKWNS